jgi:hypothetical protein
VFAPFTQHREHANLGFRKSKGVVGCDNSTESGEVIWVTEHTEGGSDVRADDWGTGQSSFAQGKWETF